MLLLVQELGRQKDELGRQKQEHKQEMAGVRRLLANTFKRCAQGTVSAVGNNTGYQLGDGTYTTQSTAVAVIQLRQRVTAVAAGNYHSLFLLEDGSVKAVGSNAQGQLGDGTNTARITAVVVVGLGQRATAVAAGSCHSLFLLEDGSVNAVGRNANGQLGDGTIVDRCTPVSLLLPGSRPTVHIAAGAFHSLLMK
jgi:alpha-tubulin suppressor-like RCC1 family protein